MNNCVDCMFFGDEIMNFDNITYKDVPTGYHKCSRIKFDSDCEYMTKRNGNAIVEDGSGYYAALVVASDFGCVNWVLIGQVKP